MFLLLWLNEIQKSKFKKQASVINSRNLITLKNGDLSKLQNLRWIHRVIMYCVVCASVMF